MGYRSDATPHFAAVTPSDSADQTAPARVSAQEADLGFRALYIGSGGDVVVTNGSGTDVTFSNLPTGFVLPVVSKRVKATGTTATNIVAYWG